MATTFTDDGIATVHDPLTTLFTRPQSCSSLLYTYFFESANIDWYLRDLSPPGDGATSACYPSQFSHHHNLGSNTVARYSPGVCPSGWSAVSAISSAETEYSKCCPPGLTLDTDKWCFATVTGPTRVVTDAGVTTSISSAFVAMDWALFVEWASSDLAQFTPASAPLLNRGIASTSLAPASPGQASRASAATSTSRTTAAESARSDRISTGAEAGIGVAVAIVVLGIVGLLIWFFRRRSLEQPLGGQDYDDIITADSKTVFAAHSPNPMLEADSRAIFEARSSDPVGVVEADSSHARAELEGNDMNSGVLKDNG